LIASRRESDALAATPWLMDLMGARLALFAEVPKNSSLNGVLLKKLRGGDPVTGRALYGQNITYKPAFTIVIGGNSFPDVEPQDQAVLESIHAFDMPSKFVPAGDPRLGPPRQPLFFQKEDRVHLQFEQRAFKIALLRLLGRHYREYQQHPLAVSLGSAYDQRHAYEQREEAKTDLEWFEEHFDVLDADDGTRLKTSKIHETLKKHRYPHTNTHLGAWMCRHFKVRRVGKRQVTYGHASVFQQNHSGTWVWACIKAKPAAADDDEAGDDA